MRASIMRDVQCEQRGRSIAVKDCWDEVTMLPCFWAGALTDSLSPMDAYGGTVMRISSHVRGPDMWSILLTSEKFTQMNDAPDRSRSTENQRGHSKNQKGPFSLTVLERASFQIRRGSLRVIFGSRAV